MTLLKKIQMKKKHI